MNQMIPHSVHVFLLLSAIVSFTNALAANSVCSINGVQKTGAGNCENGDIFLKGNFIELGVNNVASYGTKELAPSSYAYAGNQLGFIADYDKNGFTGSPGYSGDYFVPGIPLEGWILQWNSSSGAVSRHINQGLMNKNDNKPQTFSITSTESTQSCLWIGLVGDIEASISTRFNNDDLFFTTTVTLQNVGSDILRDLYCKYTTYQLQPIFVTAWLFFFIRFAHGGSRPSKSLLQRLQNS
jgi:hypothetical protein